MDELRVVRREEQSLIVANDKGEQFKLVVDASILAELRHLGRQSTDGPKVNPREIQSLVRAGKSRSEIIEITGVEEDDIERYEEPVLAERRFILSKAQSVPVRTTPSDESEDNFGSVVAERLIGLGAIDIKWDSWRDEEAGWMIGLTFVSHEVDHRAVWSFDHRKNILAPISPDAVTLSKQGEVGDRLIPKLRAVDSSDSSDRFDSGAFDHKDLPLDPDADESRADEPVGDDTLPAGPLSPGTEAAMRAGHPSTGSIPVIRSDDEFARRREIDQRAIKTPSEQELPDLGQTADLLDALRRRRGAREDAKEHGDGAVLEEDPESLVQPVPLRGIEPESADIDSAEGTPEPALEKPAAPMDSEPAAERGTPSGPPTNEKRPRGRTSIPSWDDILFGTRSEEDPS